MGQMFQMHAYSLVSTCNAAVCAECVTNGVVRFFVCCATFALLVGLHFFVLRQSLPASTRPSSSDANGAEVPDECPYVAPSLRGATVQKFLMHAYSMVSLASTCSLQVHAGCATSGVVWFFVFLRNMCSVGWSVFFRRGVVVFSGHVSFNAL